VDRRRRVRDHFAVAPGLTLSGAAALSHDLWVSFVRGGHASATEQLRVARIATVGLGVVAVALGMAFSATSRRRASSATTRACDLGQRISSSGTLARLR
jgi:hypothetical protein